MAIHSFYLILVYGHADVTALIDNTGVIATYYYDAFGNIQENTGDTKNPFKYAGYQYDDEIGSYYLNSRYYDPATARFLSEDTHTGSADDPLSLNLYTYCHNEPLMYSDPTGHDDVVVTTEDGSENLDGTYDYETGEYTDIDSLQSGGHGYTDIPEYNNKIKRFVVWNKDLRQNAFIEYDTSQGQQDAPVYFDDGERLNGTTMKVTVVNCGDGNYRLNTRQYYAARGYDNVQITKRTDQVNSSANDAPVAQEAVSGSNNISVNIQGDNLGNFQTEISDKNGVLVSYPSDGYGNSAVMGEEEFEQTKQALIQDAVVAIQCPPAAAYEVIDYGLMKLGERIAISRGEQVVIKGTVNTNRVFWSGGDTAKNAAEAYAKNNGATTLEMTQKGITLTAETKNMPWKQAKPLWEGASSEFAYGAKGEVTVFQVAERGVNIDSIWANQEFKALVNNPYITKINYNVIMPDGSIKTFSQSLK